MRPSEQCCCSRYAANSAQSIPHEHRQMTPSLLFLRREDEGNPLALRDGSKRPTADGRTLQPLRPLWDRKQTLRSSEPTYRSRPGTVAG